MGGEVMGMGVEGWEGEEDVRDEWMGGEGWEER